MTKMMKCRRCNGTGFVFTDRICFGCNGSGEIVADKFLRVLGTNGNFYGITGPVTNGKQYKGIARSSANMIAGYTAKQITEEQARKFFARYGVSTENKVTA